jgi:hypothetical protein
MLIYAKLWTKCKSSKKYVPKTLYIVLETNDLCLSAGNRRNQVGKEMACSAKDSLVWVHRTVRWWTRQGRVRPADSDELAALGTSTAAYGYKSPDCPVVHRTVRWCTDCPVSQQSAGPTVGRGIRSRRMAEPTVRRGTGLSGVYRTVSGAPTARNLQRSASPNKERDPHRTVRYARR